MQFTARRRSRSSPRGGGLAHDAQVAEVLFDGVGKFEEVVEERHHSGSHIGVHRSALHVTANDPTGLSHKALTGLQKRFYPTEDPQDYYAECLGGKNASYRKPPWWLRTEDFIELSSES